LVNKINITIPKYIDRNEILINNGKAANRPADIIKMAIIFLLVSVSALIKIKTDVSTNIKAYMLGQAVEAFGQVPPSWIANGG
jgi:hypothetical protein